MIAVKQRGDFGKTTKFLTKASKQDYLRILEKYAKEGATALASATPVDSGATASSWDYQIQSTRSGYTISFTNSNVVAGVPIAIILQYGHGTKNGGYVQGYDYINPAIQPIFDKLKNEAWRGVTKT